jgi:hypothetical protein
MPAPFYAADVPAPMKFMDWTKQVRSARRLVQAILSRCACPNLSKSAIMSGSILTTTGVKTPVNLSYQTASWSNSATLLAI